jgi:multiple sugar transport system ATP-binding protein
LLIKLGEQQQYAKPQVLYDSPQNLFVAEFLGNPPINKIYGEIQKDRFVVAGGNASCQVLNQAKVAEGTQVVMGVRAESIVITPEPDKKYFSAKVTQIYRMGKEELTHLDLGNCEIRAYIPAEAGLASGDVIPIGFKEKGAFLFNAKTGERLI